MPSSTYWSSNNNHSFIHRKNKQMKYMLTIALVGLLTACGNNSSNSNSQPAANAKASATNDSPAIATGSSGESTAVPTLTCQLNGQAWKGRDIYNGHLYYAKGITGMYGGKPYMMLSFRATTAPDNRQLTISFHGFQGKTGVYAKEAVEVLLSGAASGEAQKTEMQGHKVPGRPTDFSIELTEWKATRADEAVISGQLSGTLKGVMGSPDVTIENGQFTNVAVKVYNDKY
jgi:hypothetical protein